MNISVNSDGMQIPPSLPVGFKLREVLRFFAFTVKTEMLMHICKEIFVIASGVM